MSGDPEKVELIRKWMALASGELAYAQKSLEFGEQFNDKVCFHCQQAAEKALKALLIALEVRPPKTHDIRALVALVSKSIPEMLDTLSAVIDLTDYAVEIRYPDEWYVPDSKETRRAIELARTVLDVVGAQLQQLGYW